MQHRSILQLRTPSRFQTPASRRAAWLTQGQGQGQEGRGRLAQGWYGAKRHQGRLAQSLDAVFWNYWEIQQTTAQFS